MAPSLTIYPSTEAAQRHLEKASPTDFACSNRVFYRDVALALGPNDVRFAESRLWLQLHAARSDQLNVLARFAEAEVFVARVERALMQKSTLDKVDRLTTVQLRTLLAEYQLTTPELIIETSNAQQLNLHRSKLLAHVESLHFVEGSNLTMTEIGVLENLAQHGFRILIELPYRQGIDDVKLDILESRHIESRIEWIPREISQDLKPEAWRYERTLWEIADTVDAVIHLLSTGVSPRNIAVVCANQPTLIPSMVHRCASVGVCAQDGRRISLSSIPWVKQALTRLRFSPLELREAIGLIASGAAHTSEEDAVMNALQDFETDVVHLFAEQSNSPQVASLSLDRWLDHTMMPRATFRSGIEFLSPSQLKGRFFDGIVWIGDVEEEHISPLLTALSKGGALTWLAQGDAEAGDASYAFAAQIEQMGLSFSPRLHRQWVSSRSHSWVLSRAQHENERITQRSVPVSQPAASALTMSVTEAEAHAQCPFAGFVRYRLEVPTRSRTTDDGDPFSLGRMIHSALEAVIKEFGTAKVIARADVEAYVFQHPVIQQCLNTAGSTLERTNLVNALHRIVQLSLVLFAEAKGRVLEAEHEVFWDDHDLKLKGRIDVLVRSNDANLPYEVWDLKTGTLSSLKDRMRDLGSRSLQLPVYGASIKRSGLHHDVVLRYISLRDMGLSAEKVCDDALIEATQATLQSVRAKLDAGDISAVPDKKTCALCAFVSICRTPHPEAL